jgi:hypothetical protein
MHKPDPILCEDDLRRKKVRSEGYNGIDYLEVDLKARTLTVFLLAKLENPKAFTARNFVIHGGERVRDVQITDVKSCVSPDPRIDDCLVLTFDKPGDYSTYTLCIVALDADGRPTDEPYPGFDRRYACLDFTFAIDCPTDLDCQTGEVCPPEAHTEPEINYLAKDYASFRQLILDRLALIMPDWQERHVPDLGITLVELLAYTGDYLSYYQDAVATEAYLDTARQRISVRRHAQLVDYHLHEGSNARAWVCLTVDAPTVELDPADITFLTRLEGYASVVSYHDQIEDLPAGRFETFAPLLPGRDTAEGEYRVRRGAESWTSEPKDSLKKIVLRQAHNRIHFYTWGDENCCLPRGATSAWLIDEKATRKTTQPPPTQQKTQASYQPPPLAARVPAPPLTPEDFKWTIKLQPGDFLVFEEILGPKTGVAADADPAHRHVVRLTNVKRDVDPLYGYAIVEITWSAEDALPFPLCLSAPARLPDCKTLLNVSVACGNVLLVDHGRPVSDEDLSCVPGECLPGDCECGRPGDVTYRPGRYRPSLQLDPLVFRQPLPAGMVPAARLLDQDPSKALPDLRLLSFADPICRAGGKVAENDLLDADRWFARPHLLDSPADARHFVAEIDNDGHAHLRYGDDNLGVQPAARLRFLASYRTSYGPAGNVGAETITHLAYYSHRPDGIQSVRNPLPAAGGTAPEPLANVKLYAPHAFRQRLERAVLASDYADIVLRDFPAQVQRAHAELQWTGSGYEALVAVDVLGGTRASPDLLAEIEAHLASYRRIGHNLAVRPAHQAGLVVEMEVCAAPEFLPEHVKEALLDVFSNRRLIGGGLGFFHPDRLTFGQGIRRSDIVAEAMMVPGVLSVDVTGLRRISDPHDPTGAIPDDAVSSGLLPLGALEIALLDNDPSLPENGRLVIHMRGGR